jgi:hypothetical protein
LAEAADVCLERHQHGCGRPMAVSGTYESIVRLQWTQLMTEKMRRGWNDLDVAVENDAYGIAILLVRQLAGFTTIERSCKGTGFDWWLGKDDDAEELFQKRARLEVSGLFQGSLGQINQRVQEKIEQTKQSDMARLPAFIIIIEFGSPTARMVQR